MSETFGLTGVDMELPQRQRQEAQPQQSQQQQQPQLQLPPQKKIPTTILPKKDESNLPKGNQRLPPIDFKKGPSQQNLATGGQNQQSGQLNPPGGNSNAAAQPNSNILGKGVRVKSSKSASHLNKIDTLKTFLENNRQTEKNKNVNKKGDTIEKSPQKKRQELESGKKEKKAAFLEGYKKKIEEQYDDLYRQDEYKNVITQLKSLESKVKLKGEIKRTEDLVTKDQKEFNNLRYEIGRKQKQLEAVQIQLNSFQDTFTTEEERRELEKQQLEFQKCESEYEDEVIIELSLRNMAQTRKKLLLFEKKKSELMYEEFMGFKEQQHEMEEGKIKNQQKYTELDKKLSQSLFKSEIARLPPRFQELLEDELSEYEDKNALNEIFKHEQNRKDDIVKQEREAKKIELEQQQFEKQKQLDKLKQEQRQIEQILNQKRKNMEELLRSSCVSDISELEERKQFLEDSNRKLKGFELKYQEIIDSQKSEIADLKVELTQLKYIQKESKKIKNNEEQDSQQKKIQVVDEVNLTANVNIDKFEQYLIEETDKLQDKENSVKRLEKVVDEITLVFSRILYQLLPPNQKQKNAEVKRQDLRNHITVCGLKLEKIISFLAKKKDSLRVESINTDADNYQPPEYVGINSKSYIRQRDLDEQREFQEQKEPIFEYKEDDPDELDSDKYLNGLRSKVHRGSLIEEEEENVEE